MGVVDHLGHGPAYSRFITSVDDPKPKAPKAQNQMIKYFISIFVVVAIGEQKRPHSIFFVELQQKHSEILGIWFSMFGH